MDVTRGDGWLQKLLYLAIVILGAYILYKGAGLLMKSSAVQTVLDGGEVQRRLEDAAVRTWAPGYAASVEQKSDSNWFAGWMSQAAPVYSYLAGQAGSEETGAETVETTDRVEITDEIRTTERAAVAEESETAKEADVCVLPQETAVSQDSGTDGQGEAESETVREVFGRMVSQELLEKLSDYDYLLNQYFTVDGGTVADEELLDAETLLSEDLSIEKNADVPQILIYHTHSQEEFADSVPGDLSTTIIGMGEVLAELLRGYGYQVIHDTQVYDLVDGVLDRSAAYDYARASVEQILNENPTIEVIIDLHRDGVDGHKFVTQIDGKPTSMIMFFNGISRNSNDEPLTYLKNPYISQNLAFSLQMELKAREQYPGYTRNIYLKAERFNLHLRPRSLLIEAGTQLNTVEEERNAMVPLADLLHQVLSGA